MEPTHSGALLFQVANQMESLLSRFLVLIPCPFTERQIASVRLALTHFPWTANYPVQNAHSSSFALSGLESFCAEFLRPC
jgi:hypothetical protein